MSTFNLCSSCDICEAQSCSVSSTGFDFMRDKSVLYKSIYGAGVKGRLAWGRGGRPGQGGRGAGVSDRLKQKPQICWHHPLGPSTSVGLLHGHQLRAEPWCLFGVLIGGFHRRVKVTPNQQSWVLGWTLDGPNERDLSLRIFCQRSAGLNGDLNREGSSGSFVLGWTGQAGFQILFCWRTLRT